MTLWLLWRNLRTRAGANALTVLAVALAVMVGMVVPLLLGAFREGVIRAANSFDLLITAKGSQSQAVLNTIFLQDAPLGTIPYSLFTQLQADPRTEKAIPIAFGDNYNGFSVLGTSRGIFELRPAKNQASLYRLASGKLFKDEFDAVIGAQVARISGLKLGDTFQSQHGLTPTLEPDVHQDNFKVVGVLESSGTPGDRAIFVPLEAVWHLHEEEHSGTKAAENEHEHEVVDQEITAIFWTPKRLGYAYALASQLNTEKIAQGVFPGQVIGGLFVFLGQGQEAYGLVIWLTLLLALCAIAINSLGAAQAAQRNLAVLRVIGASKTQVFGLGLLESAVLTLFGLVLGLGMSYAVVALAQNWLETRAALSLPVLAPNWSDVLRVAVIVPVGLVFALLPLFNGIRRSPLEQLKR
jgi:putative ABC transport system permease protein